MTLKLGCWDNDPRHRPFQSHFWFPPAMRQTVSYSTLHIPNVMCYMNTDKQQQIKWPWAFPHHKVVVLDILSKSLDTGASSAASPDPHTHWQVQGTHEPNSKALEKAKRKDTGSWIARRSSKILSQHFQNFLQWSLYKVCFLGLESWFSG